MTAQQEEAERLQAAEGLSDEPFGIQSERYDQLVGPLGADERKRAVKTLRTLLDAFDRPL